MLLALLLELQTLSMSAPPSQPGGGLTSGRGLAGASSGFLKTHITSCAVRASSSFCCCARRRASCARSWAAAFLQGLAAAGSRAAEAAGATCAATAARRSVRGAAAEAAAEARPLGVAGLSGRSCLRSCSAEPPSAPAAKSSGGQLRDRRSPEALGRLAVWSSGALATVSCGFHCLVGVAVLAEAGAHLSFEEREGARSSLSEQTLMSVRGVFGVAALLKLNSLGIVILAGRP
mmetsp:Transcript_109354/g.265793  ORF Transcript_109354/g.265793 Transcript_109354/m.265793 type:complete len:233 (+) Transcript_109354:200-898(+)